MNQYENSLVNSIHNIDEIVNESETEIIMQMTNAYTKHMILLEHADTYDDSVFFTEAASTNKPSLLSRLWEGIKKLLRLIKRVVLRIINFIKSLIMKNAKSGDQIARQCSIAPSTQMTENPPETIENISVNYKDISVDITHDGYIKIISFDKFGWTASFKNKHKSAKDSLTSGPDPKNTKPAAKYEDLPPIEKIGLALAGIGKDDVDDAFRRSAKNRDYEKVYGQESVRSEKIAIYLIENGKSFIDKLTRYIDDIETCINNNKPAPPSTDFSTKFGQIAVAAEQLNASIKIKYANILEFQTRLNKISDKIDAVRLNTENINPSFIDDYRNTFLELVSVLTIVQASMNSLTGLFDHLWEVNARYFHSVQDPSDLGGFVSECIKSGMPPKYIRHNIMLLAADNIVGDESPAWGQFRVVVFPKNKDIVYKFALSGPGISSNKNEEKITSIMKKYPNNDLIAPCISKDNNLNAQKKRRK